MCMIDTLKIKILRLIGNLIEFAFYTVGSSVGSKSSFELQKEEMGAKGYKKLSEQFL